MNVFIDVLQICLSYIWEKLIHNCKTQSNVIKRLIINDIEYIIIII